MNSCQEINYQKLLILSSERRKKNQPPSLIEEVKQLSERNDSHLAEEVAIPHSKATPKIDEDIILKPEKKRERQDEKQIVISTQSGAFFKCRSLQTITIEKLFKLKGGVQNFLIYIIECESFSTREVLKKACRPKLMEELLQAVIDCNSKIASMILDFDPTLLLEEPKNLNVTDIQSNLTWQKFLTEKPFIMAQKLKRFEIAKTILPYFERLKKSSDQKAEKPEAIKQWVLTIPLDEKSQKQQDEKLQQTYIKEYLDPLFQAILLTENYRAWRFDKKISEVTKEKFEAFRKKLFPEIALDINKAIDIEQLLIAAYKAYQNHYSNGFRHWTQCQVYAIRVVALILSAVSPELAKVYCTGLYDVVKNKKSISYQGESLKIKSDFNSYLHHFYRSTPNGRDEYTIRLMSKSREKNDKEVWSNSYCDIKPRHNDLEYAVRNVDDKVYRDFISYDQLEITIDGDSEEERQNYLIEEFKKVEVLDRFFKITSDRGHTHLNGLGFDFNCSTRKPQSLRFGWHEPHYGATYLEGSAALLEELCYRRALEFSQLMQKRELGLINSPEQPDVSEVMSTRCTIL